MKNNNESILHTQTKALDNKQTESKNQKFFSLSKESVMEILIENKSELPTKFPFEYFQIDDIPEELQKPFPVEEREDIKEIPYYTFEKTILTLDILKFHEKNIHNLNVYDALNTVRRLFKEVPIEKWNESGMIMDVVFFQDNIPWTIDVFKYENIPLITPNHLNIRWYKVIKPGEPTGGHGKPFTVKGSIVCL